MVLRQGSRVKYVIPHLGIEGKGILTKLTADGRCFVKDDNTIMIAVCRKENVEECV